MVYGDLAVPLEEFTKKELFLFIKQIDRAERLRNPIIYCKAVRATLLALGYEEKFIEGKFRDILEEMFIYDE